MVTGFNVLARSCSCGDMSQSVAKTLRVPGEKKLFYCEGNDFLFAILWNESTMIESIFGVSERSEGITGFEGWSLRRQSLSSEAVNL